MNRKIICYKLLIISLLIVGLFGLSCKKDNNSPSNPVNDPAYYFKYKDIKYEILKSLVILDPDFGTASLHKYHVYLTSEGITYDSFHKRMNGTGNGLMLDLIALTDTSFSGSNYAIHPEHITPEVKDILNARIMMNGDFYTMDGEIINLESGGCSAAYSGNICKFKLNFTDALNDSITGEYAGYFELF